MTRIAVLFMFVVLAGGFSTGGAAPDGNRFETSRTFHLGAGHAVRTFTFGERDGVILLNRLTVRHGVRARVDARIPGLAEARVVTSRACRRQGGFDVCTQQEEWCPMPAATWHVRLVKLSGPAGPIRFEYVVAPPPKNPYRAAAPVRMVSGPVLTLALPPGWDGSVGFGSDRGRAAAWVLAGSFSIPIDAAAHEGLPSVPTSDVLVSVGDFPVDTPAQARWRRVTRLRLPHVPTRRRWSTHVRFAGRAVRLTITFGSRPSARTVHAVNRLLASAHG